MLACFALCHALAAAEPNPLATYVGRDNQIHVHIPRVETETSVRIDGSLDEPVWRSAAVLAGFSQFSPQDGVPAADSTQVLRVRGRRPRALATG
jgi:hypothetical protein